MVMSNHALSLASMPDSFPISLRDPGAGAIAPPAASTADGAAVAIDIVQRHDDNNDESDSSYPLLSNSASGSSSKSSSTSSASITNSNSFPSKKSLAFRRPSVTSASSSPVSISPRDSDTLTMVMQSAISTSLSTVGWIIGFVLASIGVILVNRLLLGSLQYKYQLSFLSLQFLITYIGLEFLSKFFNLFEVTSTMSLMDRLVMSLYCAFSYIFLSLSMRHSYYGNFQFIKLLTIPCIIYLHSTFYNISYSAKIKFSVFILLLGIGFVTIHINDIDIGLDFKFFNGILFGILGIYCLSQFIIWQSSKQIQYELSPCQICHTLALPSFVLFILFSLITESPLNDDVLWKQEWNSPKLFTYFLNILFPAIVTLTTYGVISNTSPITYQVIVPMKNILILLNGFIMFPSGSFPWIDLFGIIIAIIGALLYFNVKINEQSNSKDWIEQYWNKCGRQQRLQE